MVQTETPEKLRLINGEFSPMEALQIIEAMLEEEISLHKLRRLSEWIGDCNADTSAADQRIEELENEKLSAQSMARIAKEQGGRLKVSGFLEISL